tara:strand:- start:166 stop:372 length:207 start_codon:yes stop_codon:yes gene_type:complete
MAFAVKQSLEDFKGSKSTALYLAQLQRETIENAIDKLSVAGQESISIKDLADFANQLSPQENEKITGE